MNYISLFIKGIRLVDRKREISNAYKSRYEEWKKESLDKSGFFVIFNGFAEEEDPKTKKTLLQSISGGALKLYVFLGLKSNNYTGEVFYSIKSLANYFDTSERTINNWIHELEKELHLIYRIQFDYNKVSHTYLQIYSTPERNKNSQK